MKLYITLVLLFIADLSFGQKIRFTDPTNEWTIMHTYRSQATHSYENTTRTYRYNGTIKQNGYTYSRFEDGSLVREDTTLNIVYIKRYNDTVERILYDYNVKEGDTISYDFSGFPIWVEHMDTILLNGFQHKMYRVHGYNGNINNTMIEGIGNISGLTWLWSYDYEYSSHGYQLLCFTNQYVTPISDKVDLTWCRYIATNAQNIQKTNNIVRIYPQPAHNEFSIQLPETIKGRLSISNSMGQVVYERSIVNEPTVEVTDLALSAGVYYYHIAGNTTAGYKGRLVIE